MKKTHVIVLAFVLVIASAFTANNTSSITKDGYKVGDIATVKLNGKDIGVVWCAPWRIDISAALNEGNNVLEIEVANRWINRLLGDSQDPDANVRTVQFDNGLMGGLEYKTGRYTFTTKAAMGSFNFTDPLPSGLMGPVTIQEVLIK